MNMAYFKLFVSTLKLSKSVLKFLGDNYFFDSFFHNIKLNYFDLVFRRRILNEAKSRYKIATYDDIEYAYREGAFKGMIQSLFASDHFYYTPLDLAVAINVSIHGYCNAKYVDNSSIIDASYFIMNEIRALILKDSIVKSLLKGAGKDVMNYNTQFPRNEIEKVLRYKSEIFKTYFKTFEDTRFSSSMKIYHQGYGESWLTWNENNSMSIRLDPSYIREGFFLLGFDYRLDESRLYTAYRSNGIEYFNKNNGKLIWAV